jgi:hypothetical protein
VVGLSAIGRILRFPGGARAVVVASALLATTAACPAHCLSIALGPDAPHDNVQLSCASSLRQSDTIGIARVAAPAGAGDAVAVAPEVPVPQRPAEHATAGPPVTGAERPVFLALHRLLI